MKKLFFVYGTLKEGFRFHDRLGNSKLLGIAETKPEYTMYSLWDGGYPAIIHQGDTSIKGEVYEVSEEETEEALYRLEGFIAPHHPGNLYETESVETPYGEATLFVYANKPKLESYGFPIIKDGIWK